MLRNRRIRKIHAEFLNSCRNLDEGRSYWERTGGFYRWFAQLITPVPLLALHPAGKTLLDALNWLEANCPAKPLGEQVVRQYHRMLYPDDPLGGGRYRTTEVMIEKSVISRRLPQKIAPSMRALDERLLEIQSGWDRSDFVDRLAVFREAVDIYYKIGLIHPFADGNGRVARIAMNHLLRRYSLEYVVLPPLSESQELWDCLQEGHRGKMDSLYQFVARFRRRL